MGAVDAAEWACVLHGHCIQNDWATNLHQSLHLARTFLHGNYSDDSEGRSYGHLVIGSFITTVSPLVHHVSCSFLVKYQITQATLPSHSPDLGSCNFLASPKTKIIFERKAISDRWWGSGKYDRTAHSDWENCVRSQGAYFEGDWGIIVLCTMFLVSTSIDVSIFHSTRLDTFWPDLVYLETDLLGGRIY